ncbi:serine/threonine-protein kinase Nek8-like isoform X2 [Oscarella lobularis]|uniref:serine/threonine-protein kinase Nek8-like isoform X2 n=1 Tax=Oscarella lobularis TaxID=121494 RepID=UPI0033137BC3
MEKYEKIRIVGRGAYGIVYLCRRLADDHLVIIKQIPIEEMTREERQAALNEVKVLSMLNHPNIIAYYDSFLEDKALMIWGTIFEYLQNRGDVLLEEEEILRLFVQIILSLQHVHSHNILHRDLKTQNIMLCKKKVVVKIGDFGIAKVLSSKSKANTVVGTPCYISPELCEGKPYNQKSDIWALGCVLYELATLQRAFEASNLPALVLKIMRGTFAPISPRYSEDLKQLILSMLHLDPNQRPTLTQVMSQPIVVHALINLQTDIGRVRCNSRTLPFPSRFVFSRSAPSVGSLRGGASFAEGAAAEKSTGGRLVVFSWGGRILTPQTLPIPADASVTEVACGRMQKLGLTEDGRVIAWHSASMSSLDGSSILGAGSARREAAVVSSYVEGLSGVTIKQVACGDLFTACLTDRGILMTFGNGVNGALGHGDYNDVAQPKIVEALLHTSVNRVSCGACHMAAIAVDNDVSSLCTWGRGDNGRLGLGNLTTHPVPQTVSFKHKLKKMYCGTDCTVVISENGRLFACGSNRCNKLGLDKKSESATSGLVEDVLNFTLVTVPPLDVQKVKAVAMGTSHTAILTEKGECLTMGSNSFGQLGYRRDAALKGPQPLAAFSAKTIDLVQCGDTFVVAITSDGEVYTWGKGKRGRLGRALEEDCFEPTPVPFDARYAVESLCCSHGHTLMAACNKSMVPRKK